MIYFASYRFITSKSNPCIIPYKTKTFFIAMYIHDITLYGPGSLVMKNIKNILNSKFELIDFGYLQGFLGFHILFRERYIELLQIVYINSILL
jgi:hypothetical protein